MAATAHFHPHYHTHHFSDASSHDAPPSPTLTNPDMILPYNPLLNSSPTPLASSPTLQQVSLPPRPDSAVSLTSALGDTELSPEVGVATTVRMPPRAISSITTNFIGYEHGAPLSDIGEEETPVSKRSSRISYTSTASGPSSPTPVEKTPVQTRRLSTHSSSSNGSDLGDWEDFDSSKMMNERLAADVAKVGDDEIEDPDSKRNSSTPAATEDEMTLLNERAERILEHARKRLTSMEDNLSKARHSILMSPRSSPNMSELHQPAGGLYRSISLAGASSRKSRPLYPVVKTNPSMHTRGGSDTTPTGLKRLSMIPERSASALEYGRRQESPQQYQVSPSSRVGGFSPASSRSFNSPLRVLKEEEGTPSTIKTSPEQSGPRGLGINTLAAISKENISVVTTSPTTAVARSSSAMSSRSTKEIRDQMTDLRARITDLKDKAQADSMRRRSAQNMRTPSPFTAAQTPEQWYTSAPEYKEGGSPLNTNAGLGWSPSRQQNIAIDERVAPVTPQNQTYLNVEQPTTNDSRLLSDARTDRNTPSFHKSIPMPSLAREESKSMIPESHYEDAAQELDDEEEVAASEEEQVYLNEVLQESLEEVEPEVPEVPEHLLAEGGAGRHEDRLDAFDYENMFLYSVLGNYTGAGTRSLTPSESDGSSVVTTRMDQNTPTDDNDEEELADEDGESNTEEEATTPVQESFPKTVHNEDPASRLKAPLPPWMKAARSNSMDSVSTAATFATATEGEEDDVELEDEDEDELPSEILHWGNGAGFPQPPVSPRREKGTLVWPTPPLGGRGQQAQVKALRSLNNQGSVVTNGLPTPPVHSPQASFSAANEVTMPQQPAADEQPMAHPANTEILMESLIKLAEPDFQVGGDQGSMTFSDVDKDLVLDLLRAVGSVCNQILQSENKQEVRAVKVLRRRLDESRKLLEGQGDD